MNGLENVNWFRYQLKLYYFLIACTGGDKCCTSDDKCGVDEGDCDKDEDCQDGLICGKNNCSNKSGEEWDESDDCCYAPSKR